jgi:hypothetical protein
VLSDCWPGNLLVLRSAIRRQEVESGCEEVSGVSSGHVTVGGVDIGTLSVAIGMADTGAPETGAGFASCGEADEDGRRDRLGELWLLVAVLVLPLLALILIGKAVLVPSDELLDHTNRWHLGVALGYRDRTAYAVVMLLAAAALVWTLITSRSRAGNYFASGPSGRPWRTSLAVAAGLGVVVGLMVQDQRLPVEQFGGFSRIDMLLLTALAVAILGPPEYRRAVWEIPFVRRAVYASPVVVLLWRSLTLIQLPRSTFDAYHSWFVLNELLSVVGGRFPGFDFIAQYSTGLGYGFWVFDLAVPLDVFDSVFLFITLLNVLIVVTVIGVIWWAWRRTANSLWVAVVCVSAATFTVPPGMSGGASSTQYFAGMPIRQIGVAATLIGIVAVVGYADHMARGSLIAGVAAAVGVAANLETGLAALAAIVVVRIFFRHERAWPAMIHLLLVGVPTLGLLGGLVLVQQLTDAPCGIGCIYESARIFGGMGFAGADMPVFGVHSVVFVGFVLAVFVAGGTAKRQAGRWRIGNGEYQSGDDLGTVRIAAVTLGTAVFGLLGLSYYVNRSYAQLLLTVFLPLAISSMGMLTLLVRESAPRTFAERLWLLPLVLVCLVPVLSVPRLPALGTEWSRLSGDLPSWIHPIETEFPVIDSVLREAEARFGATPDEVGIVATNMMVGPVRYGMRAGLAHNSPYSVLAKIQAERECAILQHNGPAVLLVLPQGMYQELNPVFECGGYREHSVIDGGYVAFVREEDYP